MLSSQMHKSQADVVIKTGGFSRSFWPPFIRWICLFEGRGVVIWALNLVKAYRLTDGEQKKKKHTHT